VPWWSIIYIALFLFVVVVATWFDPGEHQGGDKEVILVLDSISALVCAYLFASFWVSSWRQLPGPAAPWLFVLAAGWQVYDTPRGLRKFLAQPDLSAREKRWVLAVSIPFFLPAYVVAGMAAFG
jgi:hypothetical protein